MYKKNTAIKEYYIIKSTLMKTYNQPVMFFTQFSDVPYSAEVR